MTVEELMCVCSQLPYDAKVRFADRRGSNPHDDYYDVDGAYLLQFQIGEVRECALYLHGNG